MTTGQKLLTADDLWQLPDDGMRQELTQGELIRTAPAGGEHGKLAMEVALALGSHVKAKQLGVALAAGTGFIISRNPDTVRAPDAAFISGARIPIGGLPVAFIPLAPDIAVEVLSPSDSQLDVEEKIEQWLRAGTAMVWVVNPRSKSVAVHQAGRDPRVLRENDLLDGQDVCPGFSVRVGVFFEG